MYKSLKPCKDVDDNSDKDEEETDVDVKVRCEWLKECQETWRSWNTTSKQSNCKFTKSKRNKKWAIDLIWD